MMNLNSSDKEKFVWQELVKIKDGKVMYLRNRKGKVYSITIKQWRSKLTIEEVEQLLNNKERVKVNCDLIHGVVRGVYHESLLVEKEEAKKEEDKEEVVINFGIKPLSDKDKARIEIRKENNRWYYKIHLWVPMSVEDVDYHKVRSYMEVGVAPVMFYSPAKSFDTKKAAIKAAVEEAHDIIVSRVLGRDLSGFYPYEDELSIAGRKWLKNLMRVMKRYVGEVVDYTEEPAKPRFLNVKKVGGGILHFNYTGNVGYFTKSDLKKIKGYEKILTGKRMKVSFRIEPERPFLKLKGSESIYNMYHVAALMEGYLGERLLGINGRFLKKAVGRTITMDVVQVKKGPLVIDIGTGYLLLAPVSGVEKDMIQEIVENVVIKDEEVSK